MSPQKNPTLKMEKRWARNKWMAGMLSSVTGVEVTVTVVGDGLRSGLGHDGVLAPELGVNALEVVRARPEVLKRATRLIRSRVMVLLANLQFNQRW